MKRAILAVLLAVTLLVALPLTASAASIAEKCQALVTELNARRDPNVRLRSLLCSIAHSRSLQQAKGIEGPGGGPHWIEYVVYRLKKAGIRCAWVGEAIGWTTATGSVASLADRYVSLWRSSPNHWPMLSSSRYNLAGGSWRVGIANPSRTYATLIVADYC